MSLVEIHPLRKDKSLSDGTQVMSASDLGSHLSFTNYEGSTSVYPASVHGFFSKVLVHSYHLSQIVDIYIHSAAWAVLFSLRDTIRNKLFKENTLSRFPYGEKNGVKKWFTHNVSNRDLHPRRTIHMLNLNEKSDQYPKLNGAVYQPSPRGAAAGFTVLCHGTDHESAKNMIEQGIRLDKLQEDWDFGRKGFYLTEFEKAQEWAFHKSDTGETAILVFKIPNRDIDRYRRDALDLMGPRNKKKWKAFVTNKNIAREVRGISFVEGPWIKRGRYAARTVEQVRDSYQMCILDGRMANMIDSHLHSVVFYNTKKLEEDGEKKKINRCK